MLKLSHFHLNEDNKKIIFLTGATGLVGSYLLKVFLKDNYKVYALARNKKGKILLGNYKVLITAKALYSLANKARKEEWITLN